MTLIILFRKLTRTELRYNAGIEKRTKRTTQSLIVFSSQSKATGGGHGDRGIHILINLGLWISGTHWYNKTLGLLLLFWLFF